MKAVGYWALALLMAAGCAGGDTAENETGADSAAAVVPEPAAAPALTDPENAHIVVSANTIDIEAGQLAKERSKNAEVVQFAETMIKDHTAVNQEASALAQKLGVTPQDNATSQSLKTDADGAKTQLSGLTGAEFDKAYIAREVAYHQAVLDAMDQKLIPGAQNAELKALLEKTRPAIAAHLQMAQQLQTRLGQ